MPLPKPPLPKLKAATSAGAAAGAAIRRRLESAFRLPDGSVVRTGSFHDIGRLPEPYSKGERLEEVAVGFADDQGFLTRAEAEATRDLRGLEPAPMPVLGSEHSNLWLQARAEALRRHSKERK